jgi:hypothetical protein
LPRAFKTDKAGFPESEVRASAAPDRRVRDVASPASIPADAPHPFGLTLISNDVAFASASIAAGVDRVLVDLERKGKAERQAGRGLFLSAHSWADVASLRQVLPRGSLFVRVDPLNEQTPADVEMAVALGVDGLMLPFFRDAETVARFADLIHGRVAILPLVETAEAVENLDQIIGAAGLAEFHVGLNDLALSLGLGSLIDLWGDPVLDRIAAVARARGVRFGVGGVTDPREKGLPVDPAWTIAEHRRIGSTGALLGRNFRTPLEKAPDAYRIADAVQAIRAAYDNAAGPASGE